MAGFIRFVGVVNAGAWFGSLLFFTLAAGPAFFSPEMTQLLGRPHAGAAAQIIIGRLFQMQSWFAAVAILQLFIEWLYTGRPVHRATAAVLGCVVVLALAGGSLVAPKLKALHLQKYAVQTTPAQKAEAARVFGLWHGLSQAANLLVLGGVFFHLWQICPVTPASRFGVPGKFRTPPPGPGA